MNIRGITEWEYRKLPRCQKYNPCILWIVYPERDDEEDGRRHNRDRRFS